MHDFFALKKIWFISFHVPHRLVNFHRNRRHTAGTLDISYIPGIIYETELVKVMVQP